jgi:hypothetical protein
MVWYGLERRTGGDHYLNSILRAISIIMLTPSYIESIRLGNTKSFDAWNTEALNTIQTVGGSRIMPKQVTPEQKQKAIERREKFRALVRQVAQMSDSDREAMIMRVGAVVTCEGRELSPTNTMLCLMQCPGVSMVGGFKQWLRQGRAVSKGQHGIAIWIPCAGKKSDEGEVETETYFTMGTVFDISQTQEIEMEVAA